MRRHDGGTKGGLRRRCAAGPSWMAPGNSGPRPVRRPRAGLANRHSGDGGAPPEATMSLCREPADRRSPLVGGRVQQSAARRRKENATTERREAPASSQGDAAY